jgi:D-amino peptidase
VKVFVVSDMEGVAGIVKWDQVTGGHAMYEEGRRLYTGEINAAVRGVKAAGATEIVVMDCHGAGQGWTFNTGQPQVPQRAALIPVPRSARATEPPVAAVR